MTCWQPSAWCSCIDITFCCAGFALAVAVLRNLSGRASLTFGTTHYPEVKEEAERHPLFANAAVAFDVETLKPLYRCGAQTHLTVRVEEKRATQQHTSLLRFISGQYYIFTAQRPVWQCEEY